MTLTALRPISIVCLAATLLAAQPSTTGAPAQAAPAAPAQHVTEEGGFFLNNVSLTEMIDILAKQLKISYILDPGVKGAVTIHTYGEVKPVDLLPLLQTVLRINGAVMVKVGDLYRIVPTKMAQNLPMSPVQDADPKTLPDDERLLLNMVFLKYATATEIDKLLSPFMGEGAMHTVYDPANLLLIQDNSRNMRRTMELIEMFDSDTFAGRRVRLFDVAHSRPSALVKDLESVFKAYSLSNSSSAVKFIPVDRINTLIAVASNPGAFEQVKEWITKLDIQVKSPAGDVDNYVYRLKYGRAETVGMAVTALYTGNTGMLMALAMMNNSGSSSSSKSGSTSSTTGNSGYGGYNMAAMMGMGGYGLNGYGTGGYGMGGYGSSGYGMSGYGNTGTTNAAGLVGGATGTATGSNDLTGSYMGAGGTGTGSGSNQRIPRIVPNPFDNTLLIQATPTEWEQIQRLLRQLDVAPRQVLIDAKIYELDLTDSWSAGLNAYLEAAGVGSRSLTISSPGASAAPGLGVTFGALVGHSHEVVMALASAALKNHVRVISAPSIIATDSVEASMNVGIDIPVLTATSTGTSTTSTVVNSISSRSTGVTLTITPRINSSGVVTMEIEQEVSGVAAASYGSTGSSSVSTRKFSTQVTVQDGDTIAIGGCIQETKTSSSSGVPVLHQIPLLGALFGNKSKSTARTELIVLITPRVIFDSTQLLDATEEIKSNLKRISREMQLNGD
jgi:general secretion pathway protein D